MIKVSNLSVEEKWIITRKTKSKIKWEKILEKCYYQNNMYLSIDEIDIDALIIQLDTTKHPTPEPQSFLGAPPPPPPSTTKYQYTRFENMTAEDLKIAAEIFIYMNTCPLKEWFLSWRLFYNNLFETKFPDQIILTLNRLLKSKDTTFLHINQKLFKKAMSLLSTESERALITEKESLIHDHWTMNNLNIKGFYAKMNTN